MFLFHLIHIQLMWISATTSALIISKTHGKHIFRKTYCSTFANLYSRLFSNFPPFSPQGILRQMSINDLPVGRSVEETLRLVKAFQFVEKHGEVCPADWKPDSPTIKPDPVGSKDYFNKVNQKLKLRLTFLYQMLLNFNFM